jgi:hypothetical protein
MNNGYARETLESILESLESDESDESDERDEEASRSRSRGRGARGRSDPRTASDGGSYRAPVHNSYVTQKELQENIQRVDGKITTNSDAIKAVNVRVGAIDTDLSRLTTALKKEVEERKKENNGLKSNVQMASLLPVLIKPPSLTVGPIVGNGTEANPAIPANTKLVVESSNSLTTLLPLLLLGGLGSSSDGASSSSGGSGGMNDPMTMLLLVLAISGGLGGSK